MLRVRFNVSGTFALGFIFAGNLICCYFGRHGEINHSGAHPKRYHFYFCNRSPRTDNLFYPLAVSVHRVCSKPDGAGYVFRRIAHRYAAYNYLVLTIHLPGAMLTPVAILV